MGDADCTYDFRELAPFVEKLPRGLRVRHGLALEGIDRAGAMPCLHRYFGTPFTTWILNRLYSSSFSATSTAACGASRATRSNA